MKSLVVILIVAYIPVVFARMLPLFENLQRYYPGNVDYGGAYSDYDVFKAVNLSSRTHNNDSCILRMSVALNLNPGHQVLKKYNGSAKGSGGIYYFYDRNAFLNYLDLMYGYPLWSNTTEAFRYQQGIMFVNVTGEEKSNDVCSVLLWNGMSFHQGKGLLHHYRIDKVYLWPAQTGGCKIDVNVKQSTCFPSSSKVELKSGKKIAMNEIAIGDLVKTYSKDGEVLFSPVVTFLDQMPNYRGDFYSITTIFNVQVTLSEAHLLFTTCPLSDGRLTNHSTHASRVRPGDYILVNTRWGLIPMMVESVSVAERKGAFAPVTQEGTMVVDGIWVSCYADIADHNLADSLMTPLKRFYSLAPHVLGTGGKYVHGYLKDSLRHVGVKIFGKEKFYHQGPKERVLSGKETSLESLFIRKDRNK